MTKEPSGKGPPDHGGEPVPVGVSLEKLARALGAPSAVGMVEVFRSWDEVVGQLVAAHCRPVSLAGDDLVVMVDSPGWATHLQFLAPEILGGLARSAGGPVASRLRVKVGPPNGRIGRSPGQKPEVS